MKLKPYFLILLLTMAAVNVHASYSGAPKSPTIIDGTSYVAFASYGITASNYSQFEGYYAITSAEHLYGFAKLVNDSSKNSAKAVLLTDITINENCLSTIAANGTPSHSWMPIGNHYNNYAFKGVIDGQGHTISGLYFDNANNDFSRNGGGTYVGLVGYASGATIKNLGIVDSYFHGYDYMGAVVGEASSNTLVENCWSNSTVIDENSMSGGIVGSNGGTVRYCYNLGTLTLTGWSGGVAGYNYSSGKITNCYNYGKINAKSSSSASVVGYSDGMVENNYYLEGTHSKGTYQNVISQAKMMTKSQFLSGEVCWLLNGSSNDTTCHYFQTIGLDTIPVLFGSNDVVYSLADLRCDGTPKEVAYSNIYHTQTIDDHTFVDGICSVCGTYQPNYMTANAEGWYEISTPSQLYWFAAYVNAGNTKSKGKLMNDITVNTNVLAADSTLNTGDFKAWTPIGTSLSKFIGEFDGQGHVISGLYFNTTNSANYPLGGNHVGLFGYADKGSSISNVGVEDGYICGGEYVGGIVGSGIQCNIKNCYNANTIVSKVYGQAGGIGGEMKSGNMNNCYNVGKIIGKDRIYIGGVAGLSSYMTFTSCYNAGPVQGDYYTGSLVGYETSNIYTNCYYQKETTYTVYNNKKYYQNGIGSSASHLTTPDKSGMQGASAAQFGSGEITFMMNGQKSSGELSWFQTIGTDLYPVFEGDTVYKIGSCQGEISYSNTQSGTVHTLKYEEEVKATCYQSGHVAGYTCTICGKHFTTEDESVEIPLTEWIKNQLDHHVVNDDSIPATCTTTGLTAGKHCDLCGYVFVAQDTIPALGHKFTHYVYNNDATYESNGTETAHCDHEGCTETDTHEAEGTKLTPTMLDAIANGELVVYTHHDHIVVENATEVIRVYNASSQCIAVQKADKHVVLHVGAQGVYIVCVGDTSAKVVIE